MMLTYGQPLIIYYNNVISSSNSGYLTLGAVDGTGYSASFSQPSATILPTTVTLQSATTPTQTGSIDPSQPFNIITTVNNTPYYLTVTGAGSTAVTSWAPTSTTTWTTPGRTSLNSKQITSISYINSGTTTTYLKSPWIFYTVSDYCSLNPTFPISACATTPTPTPTPTPTTSPTASPTPSPSPAPESWLRRNFIWLFLFFGLIFIIIIAIIIWLTHH